MSSNLTASAKHTHQKPHMLGEIAEDGYYSRHLEIRSVVHALKYTEDKPADEFSALPERLWDALEAAKPRYGTLDEISQQLFDSAWNGIQGGWPFASGR